MYVHTYIHIRSVLVVVVVKIIAISPPLVCQLSRQVPSSAIGWSSRYESGKGKRKEKKEKKSKSKKDVLLLYKSNRQRSAGLGPILSIIILIVKERVHT